MAVSTTIKVFASPRPLFKRHCTTYIECEIPKELEEKIYNYIGKLVASHKKKCKCERCRYEKKEMLPEEENKIKKEWDEYYNREFKQHQ